MKRYIWIFLLIITPILIFSQTSQPVKEGKLKYYDHRFFLIEGTTFNDSVKENLYDRFPLSYKNKVREPVWNLSKSSAGISVRFSTNSASVRVKWELLNDAKMNHMAETGIKGIDLYFNNDGIWQFVNTARPAGKINDFVLIGNMTPVWREYKMYLPLYDGVTKLEIGIDSLSSIQKPFKTNQKPIVFYGTSITQGGCASRPGMVHTSIISRKLNVDCINFGFSGNGRMEKPVAELISGIDALFYVLDGTNNMTPEQIHENAIPLVEIIRSKHPVTPIVFVEGLMADRSVLDEITRATENAKNEALRSEYKKMSDNRYKNIFYIESTIGKGTDHESTVDGSHLTDLGFSRYADFLIGEFKRLKLYSGNLINPRSSFSSGTEIAKAQKYIIPEGYLDEADNIPTFWVSTVEEVTAFLKENVKKGHVGTIGTSAGGRPLMAVFYGQQRQGKGTTTFSGSAGINNMAPYRGPDHNKTVYLGLGGVHGYETEGIIGVVNLISVLETGKDLNGKEWPEIIAVMKKVDRIILIPLMNPDGRARVPVRMEMHRGAGKDAYIVHEFLNTGGKPDGTLIGWPDVKEFIPMDFSKVGFPGGYPNDAGVNIMHDDFFGTIQPETKALFDLVAEEKPDVIVNMHTGAPGNNYYLRMHRPFCEPVLEKVYDSLYTSVHTGLTLRGLQSTDDPKIEADPAHSPQGVYNLDAALNLHCGALSVVVEAPGHGFSGTNRAGKPVLQTPEMILNGELVVHLEAMKFVAVTGGRSKWGSIIKK